MTDGDLMADPDLVHQPDTVSEWGELQLVEWLRRGFDRLAHEPVPSRIRSAFDPVELDLESEPIAQLAGAILEGDIPGLPTAWQVEDIVRSYLTGGQAVAVENDRFLNDLWQLLSAFDLKPTIAAEARQFLNQLRAIRAVDDDLLRAVASTVASSRPAKNQQISFFDYLKQEFADVWGPDLTLVAVDLAFNKAADDRARREPGASSVARAWDEVKSRWAEEMLAIVEPGGRPGRALAFLLARHRKLDPDAIFDGALKSELETEQERPRGAWKVSFELPTDIRDLERALA